MGIGTLGFDEFRSDSRDYVDRHFPLHSPGHYQLGGNEKERLGPRGTSAAAAASIIEDKRWIRAGLAESDVFGALAEDDLDRLIVQGGTATYASGAVVFRKGEPANHLMVVLHGRIRISSAASNGKEVLFDFIGPGRCFGEVALLEGTTRKLEQRPSGRAPSSRSRVATCSPASRRTRRSPFGSSVCSVRGLATR